MYRYEHLLVGLSLDDDDHALIRYAEMVSLMAGANRVRFVHVFPAPAVFNDVFPEYRHALRSAASEMKENLHALVARRFVRPQQTAVACDVIEGAPLVELLRIAKEAEKDLIIVGSDRKGGTLAEKLARKAPCSVLIVPPGAPAVIRRVLVPVDFSEDAADAVDVAVAFAEAAGLDEVHLLHVYGAPTGYFGLGDGPDVLETLRQRAQERYAAFVQGLDLRGLAAVPHFETGQDVPEVIRERAEVLEADVLMIGSRGRTDGAAILMGSVAERLVRSARVPVVVVKRKGATLGLLDALFEL